MKILENVHNALSECRVIGDTEIWAQREGGIKMTKSVVVFVKKC
jgi:hypothetical protein